MRSVPPINESRIINMGETQTIKTDDTRYRVRIANSEQSRDGHLAVLVDHSTDGQVYKIHTPVRWGSEAQATHCREGEAGHNVLSKGTTGGTPRPQTVSPQLRRSVLEPVEPTG